ncbi:MAG: VOC family protein [Thalassobaculaceae bacterium]|nr:VOC family protein [Thalassobaculaceae bacterium]
MSAPRDIDHIVVMTRDLAAARAAWSACGFTCTPRAVHPFGTANALIQMQGNFVELLEINDESQIIRGDGDRFSFAAHNLDFLATRGEGMSMLVLASDDRDDDLTDWRAKGLRVYDPFDFERQAKQPDGSSQRVAFSLAFASDDALPGLGFFTCQQHTPEVFWKPDYQTHANGARRIASVAVTAPDPQAADTFLRGFSGGTRTTYIALDQDSLTLEEGPPAFPEITIRVADLADAEPHLPAAERDGESLVVGGSFLNGVIVRFID